MCEQRRCPVCQTNNGEKFYSCRDPSCTHKQQHPNLHRLNNRCKPCRRRADEEQRRTAREQAEADAEESGSQGSRPANSLRVIQWKPQGQSRLPDEPSRDRSHARLPMPQAINAPTSCVDNSEAEGPTQASISGEDDSSLASAASQPQNERPPSAQGPSRGDEWPQPLANELSGQTFMGHSDEDDEYTGYGTSRPATP